MKFLSKCRQRAAALTKRPVFGVSLLGGVVLVAVFYTLLTIGATRADSEEALLKASAASPDSYKETVAPLPRITITEGGRTISLTVPEGTVETSLKAAGIPLGNADRLSVARNSSVFDGMHIQLTRIDYVERTEQTIENFETLYRYTNTLSPSETAVYQEGCAGVTETVYRDRFVDGKLVSSELVSETVVQTRQDRILLAGATTGSPMSAAPFELLLDANGQPVNYTKMLTGKATAYTNDRGLCGTHTATGMLAQVGVVSVDPSIIPYGTKLYIVSADGSYTYGYAIAGDTGGAMLSGRNLVDLFMNTYEECVFFGRRQMNVYILG